MGYTIVVACGAGINTSTLGEDMISERCKAEGWQDVTVKRVLMADIDAHIGKMDILVSMMKVYREFPCPVVSGLPFLIGPRKEREALLNEIMDILKKLSEQNK